MGILRGRRAFLGILCFPVVVLVVVLRRKGVRVQSDHLFVLRQEVLVLWSELPIGCRNIGVGVEAAFHGSLGGIVDSCLNLSSRLRLPARQLSQLARRGQTYLPYATHRLKANQERTPPADIQQLLQLLQLLLIMLGLIAGVLAALVLNRKVCMSLSFTVLLDDPPNRSTYFNWCHCSPWYHYGNVRCRINRHYCPSWDICRLPLRSANA
jgi:hypothetical protein